MSAQLCYGENYLEVSDFCFYPKEEERGNPYNTTFSLIVQSCGFHGIAPCEYDIKNFKVFVDDLHRLYRFEIDKTMLEDICYGSKVLFAMDHAGHLELSGEIFGRSMDHAMKFCFHADQTVLKSFLDSLDELFIW